MTDTDGEARESVKRDTLNQEHGGELAEFKANEARTSHKSIHAQVRSTLEMRQTDH